MIDILLTLIRVYDKKDLNFNIRAKKNSERKTNGFSFSPFVCLLVEFVSFWWFYFLLFSTNMHNFLYMYMLNYSSLLFYS